MFLLRIMWAAIWAALWLLMAQALLLGALIGAHYAQGPQGELQLGCTAGALIAALLLGLTRLFQRVEKRHIVSAALAGAQAVPGLALILSLLADRGWGITQWVTLRTVTIPTPDVVPGQIIMGVAFGLIVLQQLLRRKPAAAATTTTAAPPVTTT